MSRQTSRRDFLKVAVATGAATMAAGALAGCQPQPAGNVPQKWDKESEVVVIGLGLAGAISAITAYDAKAKVLVLEKMEQQYEGGNSKVSGNLVFIPGNAQDGEAYFRGMCEGHMSDIPDEMVQTWITEMMANKAYLEQDFGLKLVGLPASMGMSPELPHLPGAKAMVIYAIGGAVGNAALWKPIAEQYKARKIETMYKTPAKRLVANAAGEVVGVIAESEGKEIAIQARKAVVLTCGGFEFSDAMKANYLHAPCLGAGTPGNAGDGTRMAQALGADLWHMNNHMGPIFLGFIHKDLAGDIPEASRYLSTAGKSGFFADKYGKRFMNESRPSDHGHGWDEINYYDGNRGEHPRIPLWYVFDEAVRLAGALGAFNSSEPTIRTGWASHYTKYVWSKDNSAEVAKGWILKGDTIEDLAAKMNVAPADLAATVARFNEAATTGKDADLGRPAATMAALKGPFYAIPAWPVMVNTQGGPRRNQKAQVMHIDGHPIPRLYSAGECGSIYAWQYQGGGNLGECLAFGRIAGKNAAAEKSL